MLAVGLVTVVVIKKALTPCLDVQAAVSPKDSFSLLVASYPKELGHIAQHPEEGGALEEWLAAANQAGEAADDAPFDDELRSKTENALQTALSSGNSSKAQEVVQQAIQHAVKQSKDKRSAAKEFVASKTNTTNKGWWPWSHDEKKKPKKGTLGKQVADAQCVFNVLSATTSVAQMAANINDVVKTCGNVGMQQVMFPGKNDTHSNICAVNLAAAASNIASIMTTLALAADQCASSIVPNVDALCSGSITGLITATAALGGSASLIASSCQEVGWYHRIPKGLTPSNVGRNAPKEAKVSPRRRLDAGAGAPPMAQALGEEASSETSEVSDSASEPRPEAAAPPRKLLFGGGKGSLATHCATEILSIAWSLAGLGFSLNSASNGEIGGIFGKSCPPKNILGGTDYKGTKYHVQEGMCAMDVAGAIVAILTMIALAQLMAVTCTDELRLGAICGSGIDGVFTASAAIAQAATGVWIACDVVQSPMIHTLLQAVQRIDGYTNHGLSDFFNYGFGSLGVRRLQEDPVTELKSRFNSPEEVWASLGYDLSDRAAPWRDVSHAMPDEDVLGLNDVDEAATSGGLFGPPICSSS